jgi:hypothetical protein
MIQFFKQNYLSGYRKNWQRSNFKHIQAMLQHPQNYLHRSFHELFLRIDLMYWYKDQCFYVNEVETWACGKFQSFYNPDIHAFLFQYLLEYDSIRKPFFPI